jgi:5,10-methylenetetrahydromethanopterin reductase
MRVALMALSPYAMHPVHIAMSAAALDELFPGRVILCLGAGAPGDLAAAGLKADKPIGTLRETIQLCRDLFAGRTPSLPGEHFKVTGRRLVNPTDRIPIVLAASGPQMLELAGRHADGALISAATCTGFIEWCAEHVTQGARDRAVEGRCRLMAIVYTRIAHDGQSARDGIRRTMGFILRGPHHAKNVELAGTQLDQTALWDAYRLENWSRVESLITDPVINRHAAAGTPASVSMKRSSVASTTRPASAWRWPQHGRRRGAECGIASVSRPVSKA